MKVSESEWSNTTDKRIQLATKKISARKNNNIIGTMYNTTQCKSGTLLATNVQNKFQVFCLPQNVRYHTYKINVKYMYCIASIHETARY